jgi:ketosteroid isomerase-like protein
MATQQAAEEAAIRRHIDKLAKAIGAMDLEAMTSIYAPDIVSFDVEPPLQHVGEAAKWKNWEHAFTIFQPPLGYEIRDLTITVGGDVAFAHCFNRLTGTLRNGTTTSGIWVRATICWRKVDGTWLIAHDHVSVPLDIATGRGVTDLEP